MAKRNTEVQFCLTPSNRKRIIQIIKNDPCIPYSELGEQFGVSAARIGQIAQEDGCKLRPMQKFTADQVIEMRERYHTKKEKLHEISVDYPWANYTTVRNAIMGDNYKSVPMPKKLRRRRSIDKSFNEYTHADVKEFINMVILFATGIFTIEDLAGYYGITYNVLLGRFNALRKLGWNVPSYGTYRKGLPEFENVDMEALLLFVKRNRKEMRKARHIHEKPRRKRRK